MVARNAHAADARDFRPDVEGLRAVAVLAVLLYHARLAGFEGGYVGVDVFFVLSGFLITRLLLREAERTGTISLAGFWARRARRLLPASTLVVVATLVAGRFLLDPLTQGFVGRSALAASGFAANLLFWTRGGYSQLSLPEPLLHFWSLAVEEQFYLLWPLVLFGLARFGSGLRRALVVVASTVGVVSLVASIALTPQRQSFAFYWLPTRAWELLAGALLAAAGARVTRVMPFTRAILGWAGLMVMVLCFVTFGDPANGFPGARALIPVLATVAVILGGAHAPEGPGRLLSMPPLQWVGKHSYAIYLWHFPVLVLADAKWGPLGAGARLGLLLASVAVAAVSFRFVEDPVRRGAWFAARPRRSIALGGTLAAAGLVTAALFLVAKAPLATGDAVVTPTLAVAPSTSGAESVPTDTAKEPATTELPRATDAGTPDETTPDTEAPESSVPPGGRLAGNPPELVALAEANAALLADAVSTREVPSNLEPALAKVYADTSIVYSDGCLLGNGQTQPQSCEYGTLDAPRTVVIFGDSHAAQWFPAFEKAAIADGWRLVVMAKKHCPAGDVPQPETGYTGQCSRWRNNVYERIAALKPTLVVMSSLWYRGVPFSEYQRGWERTFAAVKQHAQHVVYLADTPIRTSDVPSCVAAHTKSVTACTVTRRSAINPNRRAADERATRNEGVDHLFPDDWLCAPKRCAVIIGNVLLYRDQTHLTSTAAEFLTPYIATLLAHYGAPQ